MRVIVNGSKTPIKITSLSKCHQEVTREVLQHRWPLLLLREGKTKIYLSAETCSTLGSLL